MKPTLIRLSFLVILGSFASSGCSGLLRRGAPNDDLLPPPPATISELTRIQHNWRMAISEHDYAAASRHFAQWTDAMARASDTTRRDPDYAEIKQLYERATPIQDRIDEHYSLATHLDEMQGLKAEIEDVLASAHEIAVGLPESEDIEKEIATLDEALTELKALRKRGKDFARYEPFRLFDAEVLQAKLWLERRKREAEWALKVSEALSSVITRAGLAARAAMESGSGRMRSSHLDMAAQHFKNCLAIGSKATQAGSYSDEFPLDTPMGRAPLGDVMQECKKAVARVAYLRRHRSRS